METVVVVNREQLGLCLDVRNQVFVEEQGVPAELEVDELDKLESECIHVLMLHGEQPAGTARMKRYDSETAKIQRVAMMKQWRGQGFGRKLMEAVEDQARRNGYHYAILDAQTTARPFYEGIGYRTVSEEPFYDAGILHVRMKKRLV